jgi:hypothetical protein
VPGGGAAPQPAVPAEEPVLAPVPPAAGAPISDKPAKRKRVRKRKKKAAPDGGSGNSGAAPANPAAPRPITDEGVINLK